MPQLVMPAWMKPPPTLKNSGPPLSPWQVSRLVRPAHSAGGDRVPARVDVDGGRPALLALGAGEHGPADHHPQVAGRAPAGHADEVDAVGGRQDLGGGDQAATAVLPLEVVWCRPGRDHTAIGASRLPAGTRGRGDRGLRPAGPRAALLGRAVERHGDRPGMQVARIPLDIVRPLPIAELRVTTRLLRGEI